MDDMSHVIYVSIIGILCLVISVLCIRKEPDINIENLQQQRLLIESNVMTNVELVQHHFK
jgi:hypothetical protein